MEVSSCLSFSPPSFLLFLGPCHGDGEEEACGVANHVVQCTCILRPFVILFIIITMIALYLDTVQSLGVIEGLNLENFTPIYVPQVPPSLCQMSVCKTFLCALCQAM